MLQAQASLFTHTASLILQFREVVSHLSLPVTPLSKGKSKTTFREEVPCMEESELRSNAHHQEQASRDANPLCGLQVSAPPAKTLLTQALDETRRCSRQETDWDPLQQWALVPCGQWVWSSS